MSLTLDCSSDGFDRLRRNLLDLEPFEAWLDACGEPIKSDATSLTMLDEGGVLFRATVRVRGDDNKLRFTEDRESLLEAERTFAAPRPLPSCVLPYFTAEGTPQ